MIWLICICVLHTLIVICLCLALYALNVRSPDELSFVGSSRTLWVNSSLIGFIGSLLYFSRKAYVYLITDKLYRIAEESVALASGEKVAAGGVAVEVYKTKLSGYYLYLIARPVGGLIIGPLITMIFLGGLTTLTINSTISAQSLSSAGMYAVFVVSFIGGYTSSDMFDYISKSGARILARSKLE
jgi:hypothetical protein